MNIWLINHYAVPPRYYPLARTTNFARCLMKMGHQVTIFCASSVHNSDINLITDSTPFREETEDGVHYVYVGCHSYTGNGIKRILNMLEFARKLPRAVKHFPAPDAILASSMTLQAAKCGIDLARKYGARAVVEITDLWPESIVAYGIAGPKNPAVLYLRRLEKWIYTHADDVIFTMEGAYDYIAEQGWKKEIPRSKVHYINNGVDLEAFRYNREHFRVDDADLQEPDTCKVVYTGSLRKANSSVILLLEAAQVLAVQAPEVRILIYGGGDLVPSLQEQCRVKHLDNVYFKGRVDKHLIPYILSCGDINVLNCENNEIYRFGVSQNKLFEYIASGKPILSGQSAGPSIIETYGLGISRKMESGPEVARAILEARETVYSSEAFARAAADYDFRTLTEKLVAVLENQSI